MKTKDSIINLVIESLLKKGIPNSFIIYRDKDTYTLLQDGLIKAVQGITTIEEVLKLVELDDSEPEKGFVPTKEDVETVVDDSIETIAM